MDTLEFFRRILPRKGFKVLAEVRPSGRGFNHIFCHTHEHLADAALQLDAQERTVYHACATYKTDENRKADNAGWMRSFWVDLDVDPVGPGKYRSAREAAEDLLRATRVLGLDTLPLLVKSGRGLHAYICLDDDLPAGDWLPVAGMLKAALGHLGVRQDRTRTADAASVLRPVGTHWRKDGERVVRVVHPGGTVSLDALRTALAAYIEREGVADSGLELAGRPDVANGNGRVHPASDDLSAGLTYPDSSGHAIVARCGTLAHVASARGAVEEPLWRGMLGLVKHTIEGNDLCHQWSAGHPEYDPVETQEKIDRWETGPTTCAYFRNTNDNKCDGCPHKVTSPIVLGYTEDAAPPVVEVPPAEPDAEPEEFKVPNWPDKMFRWSGRQVQYASKDPDGNVQWIGFCDTLFYVEKRVRLADHTWALRIRHRDSLGHWHFFDIPTKNLASPQDLAVALAAQEIILYGKNGRAQAQELLRQYMHSLQRANIQQSTTDCMGWNDNFTIFTIGGYAIGANGETEVLLGKNLTNWGWRKEPATRGTLERWKHLINTVYNRPGAELHQAVIGAALAAPLVALAEVDNWHGIPLFISGGTGHGKTTVCKAAMTIYGRPGMFTLSTTTTGSTTNAMLARVGLAKNLPLIIDELTGRKVEDLPDLMYSLSNGKPKDRVRTDGSLADNGMRWKTITLCTSNDNIMDQLAQWERRDVTQATQVRVFEMVYPEDLNKKVWGGEAQDMVDLIEHDLYENYGHAAREWIPFIIRNRDAIRADIRKARLKFDAKGSDDSKERYFRDMHAAIVVALLWARKAGLVQFNPKPVSEFLRVQILKLRQRRRETTVPTTDIAAKFFSALYGRIIYTKYFASPQAHAEGPIETPRGPPAARVATVEKRVLVMRSALQDWCIQNKVQATWLVDQLGKDGYLVYHQQGKEPTPFITDRLTRNVPMPSAVAQLLEFDYDMVYGLVQLGASSSQVSSQESVGAAE